MQTRILIAFLAFFAIEFAIAGWLVIENVKDGCAKSAKAEQ